MATTLGAQIKNRLVKQREIQFVLPGEFKSWFCRAVKESINPHRKLLPTSRHYIGKVPFEISNRTSLDTLKEWLQEIAEQEELEAFFERGSVVGFRCDCDNGCDACTVTCYIKIK